MFNFTCDYGVTVEQLFFFIKKSRPCVGNFRVYSLILKFCTSHHLINPILSWPNVGP